MKLLGFRIVLSTSFLCALAVCLSCTHHEGGKGTAARPKPGPEETFQMVMDTFRRRIEDSPIGFVVSDASGRSTMSGSNKVTYELIKPAKDGDPYKAEVTVESKSNYSILRTKEGGDEKQREKDGNGKSDSLLKDADKENGVESFDPSVAGAPGPNAEPGGAAAIPHGSEGTVARRPDVERRTYELIFKDGRWGLVTELNKETEQSVQNAFRSAFETQM